MRLLLYSLAILLAGCAHVTSPTGGPKDETPPTKISSSPEHETKNFKGKSLEFTFDEWIKLKDPKEEIIITPEIKSAKFLVKKNKLEISWDEKLLDNTTYTIAFREAVQDLNEGNPAENLTMAFSTGPIIDTLKISGKIIDALKDAPQEKFTIGIYTSDTFDILKHKPTFFSKSNKTGKFTIPNLKQGKYYIYAFNDKSKNLILDSKTEAFGFNKEPIVLTSNYDSIDLKTYKVDSRPLEVSSIRPLGYFTKVRLNKAVEGFKLTQLNKPEYSIPSTFSQTQSEIDLFPNSPLGDSILVKLFTTDSVANKLDTVFYVKQTTDRSLKEKIKLSFLESKAALETNEITSTILLTHLPVAIQYDSIFILQDSTRKLKITKESLKLDTIKRQLSLKQGFPKADSINWKQTKLIFAKSALVSLLGDSSITTETPFKIINPEELATINIELKNAPPGGIIQLLNDKFEVLEQKPATQKLTFKNLTPNPIQLRMLYDANNNRKWDPGNPITNTLPELIQYYRNKEGKTITPLRANWEVNIVWKTQ